MSRVTISLVFFGLLAIANAKLDGEEIIGGDEAELGDYTYQISLEVNGQSICGGSIVGESHVITAAHCVTSKKGEITAYPYRVVAGLTNLKVRSATTVSAAVAKIFVPKEYDPANLYKRTTADIAVLKLRTALPLGDNANLSQLDLPKDDRQTFAGVIATITGFGLNEIDVRVDPSTGKKQEVGGVSYGKMRYAEAKVISTPVCQRYYRDPLQKTHLCASLLQRTRQPEGVCSGDSGGPLVYNNILIGTVSTSPLGCREDQVPAIYTRVSSYLSFLKKAMNDEFDSAAHVKVVGSGGGIFG